MTFIHSSSVTDHGHGGPGAYAGTDNIRHEVGINASWAASPSHGAIHTDLHTEAI